MKGRLLTLLLVAGCAIRLPSQMNEPISTNLQASDSAREPAGQTNARGFTNLPAAASALGLAGETNAPGSTNLQAAASAPGLAGQTNAPAATNRDITIESKEVEFDLQEKAKVATYRGKVRVQSQGMQLTCELLTAKLPGSGERIESFVGEDNVVIDLVDEKGQKIHGTGNKLVYTSTVSGAGTNETIELQGNPVLETKEGPMTGDVMTYDRIRNKLNVTNPHMLIRGEAVGKTNQIALPKPAPAPQTTAP